MNRGAGTRPVVEIRNLAKSYRRGDQVVQVLRDINMDIPAGDFVALMGPSGSGKSTLLNLIAGIDTPDSGALRVDGTDIGSLERGGSRGVARGPRRLHLPVLQSDAGVDRARERRAATAPDRALARGAARARGGGARHGGLERSAGALPVGALGRPATAGRDRARDHHRSDAARCRRTHGRPRPHVRRGGPQPDGPA